MCRHDRQPERGLSDCNAGVRDEHGETLCCNGRWRERAAHDAADRQLEDILLGLYVESQENPLDTRILVRELLDNPARAEKAKDWYLRPFLTELVAVAQRTPGLEQQSFSSAFCQVYQLIGCIQYFAISSPTLTRIVGRETFEQIRHDFPKELRDQIRRLLASS